MLTFETGEEAGNAFEVDWKARRILFERVNTEGRKEVERCGVGAGGILRRGAAAGEGTTSMRCTRQR